MARRLLFRVAGRCLAMVSIASLAIVPLAPAPAATLVFLKAEAGHKPDPAATGWCSDAEQKAIAGAYSLAQANLATVLEAMDAKTEAAQAAFKTYFGTGAPGNYDKVRANLRLTLAWMPEGQGPKLLTYCHLVLHKGEPCSTGIRSARLIEPRLRPREARESRLLDALVFCEPFFDQSGTNRFTRWGSVLHELTHVVFDTDDDRHGRAQVLDIAIRSPETALVNAESYRQFAEALIAP